jgi:malonyl-CoA/methylmalonyl-CoA synthetase
MLRRFDAARVWDELGGATVWMAVPTMYSRLLDAFDAAPADVRARWRGSAAGLRLATSGSAALPVGLAGRWRAVAGAVPLERYGMTEIGMALSNPLDPAGRRAGHVGAPLPEVEIRIADEHGGDAGDGPGELWVRGPSVFAGYFGDPAATTSAFTGGWFRTGDVAVREAGSIRLLGRASVDILKTGGEKVSALEIEEVLRELDAIAEVAVVGVPDEAWGERVVAAVVAAPGREADCTPEAVRAFGKSRLAPFKVPKDVVVVSALPRNAMGKVQKPAIVEHVERRLRG